MTSRLFLVAAASTMAVAGVVVAPAIAGDASRASARLSVTADGSRSTLSVVVGPDVAGATLFSRCDAPGSLLSGLGVDLGLDLGLGFDLGADRRLSVEAGCEDYALTIDPAVETR